MDVVAKAATYLGLTLALGAGVFVRWAYPRALAPTFRRRLVVGVVVGATLVIAGGVLDVLVLLERVTRGRSDLQLVLDYLVSTRHGQATLVRSSLALVIAAWGVRRLGPPRFDRLLYVLVAGAWLGSVAVAGHSGAMGIGTALVSLVHLVAVAVWAGSLGWLALLPVWHEPRFVEQGVRWVGRVGMLAVFALAASGVVMTGLHLHDPVSNLTSSGYGQALLVKLGLVALVIGAAALNRYVFVPAFARGASARLRGMVRIEVGLLALVLVSTAVLATRSPVHAP